MRSFFKVVLIFITVVCLSGNSFVFSASKTTRIVVSSMAGAVYDLLFYEVEAQLRDLAKTARTEDLWLYVVSRTKLYDIGYGGTGLEVTPTYRVFEKDRTILRGRDTIGIHNHPLSKDNCVYSPSFNDLWQLAVCKESFRKMFNANFKGMVFDGLGIWQYDMTEETVHIFQQV